MSALDPAMFGRNPELAQPQLELPPEPFITLPSLPGARCRTSPDAALPPAGRDAAAPFPLSAGAAALPFLAPGGSVASVIACRLEQVERWGHTPESDRDKPIGAFLVDVESYARAAREDHQYREGLARVRKRLVKLAALALATIDRIDLEDGR